MPRKLVFRRPIPVDLCVTTVIIVCRGWSTIYIFGRTRSSWSLLASSFNGQEPLSALAGSCRPGFFHGKTTSSFSLRATTR